MNAKLKFNDKTGQSFHQSKHPSNLTSCHDITNTTFHSQVVLFGSSHEANPDLEAVSRLAVRRALLYFRVDDAREAVEIDVDADYGGSAEEVDTVRSEGAHDQVGVFVTVDVNPSGVEGVTEWRWGRPSCHFDVLRLDALRVLGDETIFTAPENIDDPLAFERCPNCYV